MIKKSIPLSLPEVVELAGSSEKEMGTKSFVKQFVKSNVKTSKEMRDELEKLDLIKLKDWHIVKIIDFMPQDIADLAKILPGVSLSQDEADKILAIVKKY